LSYRHHLATIGEDVRNFVRLTGKARELRSLLSDVEDGLRSLRNVVRPTDMIAIANDTLHICPPCRATPGSVSGVIGAMNDWFARMWTLPITSKGQPPEGDSRPGA
jgi:hypothetical protein